MTCTDLFSPWTESRGLWNCGAAGVVERTREMEAALPFALLVFESDNGGEFINHHLWRYFAERQEPVRFLRSRPCHKNDNAHVEQKNWCHARQLLGCERLENAALLEPINARYGQVWSPLQNYFCPSLQLQEKSRQGSHTIKGYHPAQTACARLLAWPECPRARRRELREMQAGRDPLALVEEQERRLRKIVALARRSSRPPGPFHAAPAPAPAHA